MQTRQTIADITRSILLKYSKESIVFGEYAIVDEIYNTCVRRKIMLGGKVDKGEIQHKIFAGLDRSRIFKKTIDWTNRRVFTLMF